MADDKHYVPGDFYRLCDISGFKVRANRTKKQWNNYIVREQSFELRQPQDFVRGVRDDQTVPEPRPRQVNVFLQNQTTINSPTPYGPGTAVITVADVSIFTAGDTYSVMQDDGTQIVGVITAVLSFLSQLTLGTPLLGFASNGNIVFDLTYPQLQPEQLPASNGNY